MNRGLEEKKRHSMLETDELIKQARLKKRMFSQNLSSPTHIDSLVQSRSYSLYGKGKRNTINDYEGKITNREWWRPYIKDTPVPGHYEIKDFLQDRESNPVKATYNFRAVGRKTPTRFSQPQVTSEPGIYELHDFVYDLEKRRASSAFKSSGRKPVPGYLDKQLTTTPCHYNIKRDPFFTKSKPLSSFLSSRPRFAEIKNDAPDPGHYNPRWITCPNSKKIYSAFRSTTKRTFNQSNKKSYLGPGWYFPTRELRQDKMGSNSPPKTIKKLGRNYGIFFPTSVGVE